MRNRIAQSCGKMCGQLTTALFMLMAVLMPAIVWAQNAAPQPKLAKSPQVWIGYLVMFILLAMVVVVSLMPSKRSHQD